MNIIGKQIDRYRILEQIGQGGMAFVYKAYDTRLERDVAFKMIRTENIPPIQLERLLARFEREAKSQAKFRHAHIVMIYDYGEYKGSPYLVMEYIEGDTLKSKTGTAMAYENALKLILPIANALTYSHEKGILHRDVKPSNILLGNDDVYLTDFGIAKILDTDEATLTGTGLGVGTPEYMAPEQWKGKPVPQTDIYALGVVFYELVTGQKPYTAETPAAIAIKQAMDPLPRPMNLVENLPIEVEKVLLKALAVRPEDRYETMGEFEEALNNLYNENIQDEYITVENQFNHPQRNPVFFTNEISNKIQSKEMFSEKKEINDDQETIDSFDENINSNEMTLEMILNIDVDTKTDNEVIKESIIQKFINSNLKNRREISYQLIKLNDNRIIMPLLDILNTTFDRELKKEILKIIVEIDKTKYIPELKRLLIDGDEVEREYASYILSGINNINF